MRKLAALALCAAVGGCGTYLPGLTSEKVVPVALLMEKIQCEFQQAVWYQIYHRHRKFLKNWQAAYSVTLKSNETGGLQAKTNTFPFTISPRLLANINAGASATTTANRTGLLKFSLDFSAVPPTEPLCDALPGGSLHPFISGRIGFAEWMDRAFEGASRAGTAISSLGHTFEFSIEFNATAGSEFVIGVTAPTTSLNPGISMNRLDDGIVDVTMGPAATDTKTKTVVQLTEADRVRIAELSRLLRDARRKRDEAETALAKEDPRVRAFVQRNQMTIQGPA
jgi:hypothetical protein